MKKLKLTIISTLILALGCVSFLFPTKAYASVVYNNEQEQAFFESYEAVCTLNLQGGITASNVEEYYSVSGAGVLAGEEAGSKLDKAGQLGVPIISLNDLLEMIK